MVPTHFPMMMMITTEISGDVLETYKSGQKRWYNDAAQFIHESGQYDLVRRKLPNEFV